uniref:Uncharacterized protein n=1 Tax=Oryza brachyantha TaxID=4533 RepID=J3L3E9_ORYBR
MAYLKYVKAHQSPLLTPNGGFGLFTYKDKRFYPNIIKNTSSNRHGMAKGEWLDLLKAPVLYKEVSSKKEKKGLLHAGEVGAADDGVERTAQRRTARRRRPTGGGWRGGGRGGGRRSLRVGRRVAGEVAVTEVTGDAGTREDGGRREGGRHRGGDPKP